MGYTKLKKLIRKVTPHKIQDVLTLPIIEEFKRQYEYSTISFAQEGEDLVLNRFFSGKTDGIFVDVGAHHPKRFSNTYFFYLKGWRGINIDAMPGSMEAFNKIRPNDINIECPISDKEETIDFYTFNDPALNTFSKELADEYIKGEKYFVVSTYLLQTQKLKTILDKYVKEPSGIDFLTIDVEGLDLNVLKSNDWNRYKPKMVLIEFLNFEIHKFLTSELYQFMIEKDYFFYAKTYNTIFFRREK